MRLGTGEDDLPPPTRRPTVCLFTDSREPSGVGEHMILLLRRLAGRYRFLLVCPPGFAGERLAGQARAAGADSLLADALRDVPDWHRTRAWLGERRVDLLHVHAGITWEGMSAHHLVRAAKVAKLLRTEHLPHLLTDEEGRAAYAASVREVDRVVCVSEGVRRSFAAAGTPAPLLHAVPNGVEPPAGAPARPADPPPVFLAVARLCRQKGLDVLIESAPLLLARRPDARLLIVGTGPLDWRLRTLARVRGVGHAVEFLGHRPDVPALIDAAAALVLPSRFEGLPLSALEAMARGAPVVATDVCGNADAVAHGETGLLVPPEDPAALAEAMLAILDDPARARAMGRRGRARMLESFTAARMAAGTARHYDELIGVPAECRTEEYA